jgi:hypothetical protein
MSEPESSEPTPPAPADHEGWARREFRELEGLAQRVAHLVHEKIAPLIAAVTAPKIVADVAAFQRAPSVSTVVAVASDAAAIVPALLECISNGETCPMHGVTHE